MLSFRSEFYHIFIKFHFMSAQSLMKPDLVHLAILFLLALSLSGCALFYASISREIVVSAVVGVALEVARQVIPEVVSQEKAKKVADASVPKNKDNTLPCEFLENKDSCEKRHIHDAEERLNRFAKGHKTCSIKIATESNSNFNERVNEIERCLLKKGFHKEIAAIKS